MTAIIMDGKKLASELQEDYKKSVLKLKEKNITPKLVVITVGNDPASKVYVGQKQKKSLSVGMDFEWITMDESTSQEKLEEQIQALNEDDAVSGMIVQFPLPKHLDEKRVTEIISPQKDVDGFHPYNLGRLLINKSTLVPCTPRGIIRLLKAYNIEMEGKKAVVIGRSQIVGMPASVLLIHESATVTVTHSRTQDIAAHLQEADIIIAAVGRANFVTADQVKEGAVIIDVGINRLDNGKLAGDVEFEGVSKKAHAITPVPGGVGPMTVAMLLEQTIICACLQNNLEIDDYLEIAKYDGK